MKAIVDTIHTGCLAHYSAYNSVQVYCFMDAIPSKLPKQSINLEASSRLERKGLHLSSIILDFVPSKSPGYIHLINLPWVYFLNAHTLATSVYSTCMYIHVLFYG